MIAPLRVAATLPLLASRALHSGGRCTRSQGGSPGTATADLRSRIAGRRARAQPSVSRGRAPQVQRAIRRRRRRALAASPRFDQARHPLRPRRPHARRGRPAPVEGFGPAAARCPGAPHRHEQPARVGGGRGQPGGDQRLRQVHRVPGDAAAPRGTSPGQLGAAGTPPSKRSSAAQRPRPTVVESDHFARHAPLGGSPPRLRRLRPAPPARDVTGGRSCTARK